MVAEGEPKGPHAQALLTVSDDEPQLVFFFRCSSMRKLRFRLLLAVWTACYQYALCSSGTRELQLYYLLADLSRS